MARLLVNNKAGMNSAMVLAPCHSVLTIAALMGHMDIIVQVLASQWRRPSHTDPWSCLWTMGLLKPPGDRPREIGKGKRSASLAMGVAQLGI